MTTKPINIEFKYPWTMTWIESVGDLIEMVKSSLKPSDPLFGKEIYVSGKHEYKQLLLIDNDTDDTYAIVSIVTDSSQKGYYCKTLEEISTTDKLAEVLHHEHLNALQKIKSNEAQN